MVFEILSSKIRVFLRPIGVVLRYILLGESTEYKEWIIFSLLSGIYLGFSLALVTIYGSTLIFQWTRFTHDNMNHLYIPRAIIDNGPTSRLSNLGAVWLPLYHLSIMIFTVFNTLYTTGLSSILINIFSTASTAVVIYKAVGGRLGAVASILYGLNMYTVIHASSSYMAPLGSFLAIASLYYFEKHLENKSMKDLTKSSVYAVLATLTRYEAWVTAVLLFAILLFYERKRRLAIRIAYGITFVLGIALWIAYNYVIFRNPLQFVYHPSAGARGYYGVILGKMLNPLHANYLDIIMVMYVLAGPIFLLLLTAPIIVLENKFNGFITAIIYASPLIFFLAEGPELIIVDHSLYFYFTLPFIIVLGFKGLEIVLSKVSVRVFTAIIIVSLMIIVSLQAIHEYYMYNILGAELYKAYPLYTKNRAFAHAVRESWLKEGGYILSSSLIFSLEVSVLTGVSPAYIIDEYDMPFYTQFSEEPWKHNVTIVILPTEGKYAEIRSYLIGLSGSGNHATLYYENTTWRILFEDHYEPIIVEDPYIVYVLREHFW